MLGTTHHHDCECRDCAAPTSRPLGPSYVLPSGVKLVRAQREWPHSAAARSAFAVSEYERGPR